MQVNTNGRVQRSAAEWGGIIERYRQSVVVRCRDVYRPRYKSCSRILVMVLQNNLTLFTDLYELTIAASYFQHRMFAPATLLLASRPLLS